MLLTSLLLAAAAAAAPASPPGPAGPAVELVPMIGMRNGVNLEANAPGIPPAESSASGTLGLDVIVAVRPDGWFHAFVDHQSLSFPGFDLAVDYVQFGGGYQPEEGRVRPFVAASLGFTRYGVDPGAVRNAIDFSGSIAGGFKVPIGKRLAFRFEVRGYATFGDAAVSVACGPGCSVQFAGTGWYQLAARAGLAIRL
jgi:hypothetical protein